MQGQAKILWALGTGFLLLAASVGYVSWQGYERIILLDAKVAALSVALASTTSLLKDDIEAAQARTADAISLQQKNVDAKLGTVSAQVGAIGGTVNTLQKLSQTDPQLLAKYSKVFFLNEHYAPERTSQIPAVYVYSSGRTESIHSLALPHLTAMLDAAKEGGNLIYVKSAYRPFDEQKALKNEYSVTYGAGTANQFSADQGYSEHQLGTTVDVITVGQSGALAGFEKTASYRWMLDHAHQYGFILSYPAGNAYYIFEPWHWRYVGVKLATDLHNSGKNFYDTDQREIDAYLTTIFD